MKISTLSDKDLLALCKKYGTQAILWRRKFLGLLPEVDERKLYEKKKCSSIYEFGAKWGSVTKEYVQRVIQIDTTFAEKEVFQLRTMLQEGSVSISKLTKIVSVVSIENELEMITAVKNLPHDSLEVYVRDVKRKCEEKNGKISKNGGEIQGKFQDIFPTAETQTGENGNGLSEPLIEAKTVRPNTFEGERIDGETDGKMDEKSSEKEEKFGMKNETQKNGSPLKKLQLNLSEKILDQLLELQNKGIKIDVLLNEFLQKRNQEIAQEKQEVAEEQEQKEQVKSENGEEVSRHVPRKVEKILRKEFGTKCAVRGCKNNAINIHHTAYFELTHSHNPYFMAPVCKEHHDIMHLMDERFLKTKWQKTTKG